MKAEKILFLGDQNSELIDWLQASGEQVTQTTEKLSEQALTEQGFSFLISCGYRHIIKQHILDLFPNRAVNLHISYLPWNRGADPNFWSFIENSPKGVTIHYLDAGIDTGDIIVQEEVSFDIEKDTLATSYEKLQTTIQTLFKQYWQEIKTGTCGRHQQAGEGSSHTIKDKQKHAHLLIVDGWDTPISQLNPSSI